MSLSSETVVAASNAWTWIPDYATTAQTDDYLLVRFPDYFDHPLELLQFHPAGPVEDAIEAALAGAREFGLAVLYWMARLDSPPGVPEALTVRGATVEETLDVLARDLSGGLPDLPPPTADVRLRWALDVDTARDGSAVDADVFGGSVAPEDRLAANVEHDAVAFPAGDGGTVVAYVDGAAVGSGGVTMSDGVARLWGGAVREAARGQGVYRAILSARLDYGVAHGATMALVKGRIETSGPILRQAGFTPHGQEVIYQIPLT
jgi:GNAT superfamily N-acetyltransferase